MNLWVYYPIPGRLSYAQRMVVTIVIVCLISTTVAICSLLWVITKLLSMVKQIPQQTQQTALDVGQITSQIAESVGNSIAQSMASAFAPPPADATNPNLGGVPSNQPLAPFYATADEDNSDPTDNDRHYGKDAILRQITESWDYDETDPTGLGLSQDPAAFGGKN